MRLAKSAGIPLLNFLFMRGYIINQWPPCNSKSGRPLPWPAMFRWAQNPEYYRIAPEEELKLLQLNTEGYECINLVRFSEYGNFYNSYQKILHQALYYIPYLWPDNWKKFKKISAQAKKAYNMWTPFNEEWREEILAGGFHVYQLSSTWSNMRRYMIATEKSYRTFCSHNSISQII
jgi:hypothetical protein